MTVSTPLRCRTCTGEYRCVLGDGPVPCEFMSIGEKPGQEEDKTGIPFSGKSGMEYNEGYLRLAGLHRPDIYVTNSVKCRTGGNNNKPSDKDIRSCADHHIPGELATVRPGIVFLLGATACSLSRERKIDLDADHGIPFWGGLYDWEGWIVPMYHPASGMHDTGQMIPMLEDWERVGKWLKGDWVLPDDPYPVTDYALADKNEILRYMRKYAPWLPGAIDTEHHRGKPYSLQISRHPGTARMVMAGDKQTIKVVHEWINDEGMDVILHSAGQDLDTLEKMGVVISSLPPPDCFPAGTYYDTMQEAYHQGNLPQGLKPLSYRLFGVRMRSFQEVVNPHSRQALQGWLLSALDGAMEMLTIRKEEQLKTKVKVILLASPEEKLLRRVYSKMLENEEYDPWERLVGKKAKLGKCKHWEELLQAYGEVPTLGIEHVPEEEAVEYGCRDADMTLRTGIWLREEREEQVKEGGRLHIQEGDVDR